MTCLINITYLLTYLLTYLGPDLVVFSQTFGPNRDSTNLGAPHSEKFFSDSGYFPPSCTVHCYCAIQDHETMSNHNSKPTSRPDVYYLVFILVRVRNLAPHRSHHKYYSKCTRTHLRWYRNVCRGTVAYNMGSGSVRSSCQTVSDTSKN